MRRAQRGAARWAGPSPHLRAAAFRDAAPRRRPSARPQRPPLGAAGSRVRPRDRRAGGAEQREARPGPARPGWGGMLSVAGHHGRIRRRPAWRRRRRRAAEGRRGAAMVSPAARLVGQGVWAALTGGWYHDPEQGAFTNSCHLYLWLFLLTLPLAMHLVSTAGRGRGERPGGWGRAAPRPGGKGGARPRTRAPRPRRHLPRRPRPGAGAARRGGGVGRLLGSPFVCRPPWSDQPTWVNTGRKSSA